MNATVWQELYQKTNALTKINAIKGLIPQEKLTLYHELIKEALLEFVTTKELHLGLKTYIGKTLRNDFNEHLKQNPCLPDESLQDWTKRIFGDEKFGMVLNFLEALNDKFTRTAASDVHPLLEIAGIPLGGLSFLFFMGNYGFTPFGIHKEASGEEGFLFHLGPGTKKFYAWDDPKYNKIKHNTQVFHDIEDWLPKATCYVLEPGDAMFIPHNVYHVADTPEFSLSFVMDYINPSTHLLEQTLLKTIGEQKKIPLNLTYHTPISFNHATTTLGKLLNKESIQQQMERALEVHILKLKSNGGILRKAILNKHAVSPGKSFYHLIQPFKIYWKTTDEKVVIYTRGHELTVKNHPQLKDVLQRWNNAASLSIDNLQSILFPVWDLADIYGLISQLLQYNAIEED